VLVPAASVALLVADAAEEVAHAGVGVVGRHLRGELESPEQDALLDE